MTPFQVSAEACILRRMEKKTAVSPVASKEGDKFNLRFPDGMRDLLASEAKKNGRSINTEIIARLSSTLEPSTETVDIQEYLQQEFGEIKHQIAKTQTLIRGIK